MADVDLLTGPGGDGPLRRPLPRWLVIALGAVLVIAAVGIALSRAHAGRHHAGAAVTTPPGATHQRSAGSPVLIGPPSHPAGTRLVGDGSLMVAVPPEWARVAIGCDRRGELVVFSGREATVRCGHPGRARIRILTAHARTTGVEARIRLSDSPSPRLRRIVPIARHGEWIWRVLVLPVHEEVIVETPDRREGRRVIGSIQPLGTDLTAVPSVIGLGAAGAQERLRTAGLYASQSNDPSADGQGLPMVIIAQTPSPGTVIRIGSTISIGAEPGPPRPREVRR